MTPVSPLLWLCGRRWWFVRSETELGRLQSGATSRGRKDRRTPGPFDRSIIGPSQQATEESALRLFWFGITVRRSLGWSRRFLRLRLRLTWRLKIGWLWPFFGNRLFFWQSWLRRRWSNLRRFQFRQLLLDELGRFVRHLRRTR